MADVFIRSNVKIDRMTPSATSKSQHACLTPFSLQAAGEESESDIELTLTMRCANSGRCETTRSTGWLGVKVSFL